MEVVGKWTIYFDWGCQGTYSSEHMFFRSDGTFYSKVIILHKVPILPIDNGGKWFQKDGMILWVYNSVKTTYAGNIVGNSMTGMMSDFKTEKGCWYAIKEESTTRLVTGEKAEPDVSGNKAEQLKTNKTI